MISFQSVRTRYRIMDFDFHHLFPRQLIDAGSFAKFFGNSGSVRIEPDDFSCNGMHQPTTDEMAQMFALPLHRGPHPRYNGMVAEHIESLRCLDPHDALVEISPFQIHLRTSFRKFAACDIELKRSPMSATLAEDFEAASRLAMLRGSWSRLQ